MMIMAKRNIKLFFRDKSAVFFSLLSIFIIIGIYALFLGDVFKSDIEGIQGIDFLMNSWIMAGILAVTSVSTTMGAFSIMVTDRSHKILKDFYSSPIQRWKIAGGYILGAFFIGFLMSLVTFVIAEIYIVCSGGMLLSFPNMLKVIVLLFLTVLSSTSMVFFLVTFFKSQHAFATASSIIGTLIGFLAGVYIPIGNLPGSVQLIMKLFPISHAGALMRQILLEQPMAISFANIPPEMLETFQLDLGIIFKFNDTILSSTTSILVLLATTIIFYSLSVLHVSRKSKE